MEWKWFFLQNSKSEFAKFCHLEEVGLRGRARASRSARASAPRPCRVRRQRGVARDLEFRELEKNREKAYTRSRAALDTILHSLTQIGKKKLRRNSRPLSRYVYESGTSTRVSIYWRWRQAVAVPAQPPPALCRAARGPTSSPCVRRRSPPWRAWLGRRPATVSRDSLVSFWTPHTRESISAKELLLGFFKFGQRWRVY